ncbi:MAG: hypothetical protein AAGK37_15220 [Pseudomonadota bacterium]
MDEVLAAGVDVDFLTWTKRSALQSAVSNGNMEGTQALLEAGASRELVRTHYSGLVEYCTD